MEPFKSTGRNQHYEALLEFIRKDLQSERQHVGRRMFSVLLWCFIIPAAVVFIAIVLIKSGLLPTWVSRYLDWVMLVFPIVFAAYVISSEVLSGVSTAFRWGGIANTLAQARSDSEWRARVCNEMRATLPVNASEWKWMVANLRIDSERIRDRAKHLTALAGGVFFLLLQGIESLGDASAETVEMHATLQGWFESSSSNIAQFVGLAIFLVLFYLSGVQTHTSLVRYLHCAELLELEGNGK